MTTPRQQFDLNTIFYYVLIGIMLFLAIRMVSKQLESKEKPFIPAPKEKSFIRAPIPLAEELRELEEKQRAAIAAGKRPRGFYWKLVDPVSGEIFEKDYPYITWAKARAAARDFALGRVEEVGEHDVHMVIYDKPHDDPGKTIVYEGYVRIPDGGVVSKEFYEEHHSSTGLEKTR